LTPVNNGNDSLSMQGLSPAAKSIVESLSSLEILKDYYLIGGTSLSLQINHRLSEDFDFCQWIPEYHPRYGIPVGEIHKELQSRFGEVENNHLSFHQVNFVIKEPTVKITFYQTTLNKPDFDPLPLTGHIVMANILVLGGSKMFVITQRDALRDYYDLYVLLKEKHATVSQMIDQARILSSKVTPDSLYLLFSSFTFDGNRFKLSDLDKLQPKYNVSADEYKEFCQDVAWQIQQLYPGVVKEVVEPAPRSKQKLQEKLSRSEMFLANLVQNATTKFGLSAKDIEEMKTIGPFTSDLDPSDTDLEVILARQKGTVNNFIYHLKDRFALSQEEINELSRLH
jgi:hypothetical protein